MRARLPQPVQQDGHAAWVVEADVGGGVAAEQRGGLFVRAGLPQLVQQEGHTDRVVKADVGGRAVRQRGGLFVRARLLDRKSTRLNSSH